MRARLRGGPACADAPALIARRERVFGPAMSPLTYERPLHLVRGEGVWLVDAEGERYLDCYNNVPVVGHSHPRVIDAIARQSRLLNTNMRYLHEAAVELAERLVASMPAGGPRHGHVRQLRQRGERHGLASRDRVDRRPAAGS